MLEKIILLRECFDHQGLHEVFLPDKTLMVETVP